MLKAQPVLTHHFSPRHFHFSYSYINIGAGIAIASLPHAPPPFHILPPLFNRALDKPLKSKRKRTEKFVFVAITY